MKYSGLITILIVSSLPLQFLANVQVTVGNCSGALFTMPGMSDEDRALVITNGHCVGIGTFKGMYPADGELLLDHAVSSSLVLKKIESESGERFSYKKVVFATMTGVDLAVIQLDATIKKIKANGYRIYSLAETLPQLGMKLEFDSFYANVHSRCEVDKDVAMLKEAPWTWRNAWRMKSEQNCCYVEGQSGTAGIEPESGLIYALAQTVYEGGQSCSLDNPCEVDPETGAISTGQPGQGYAVATASLYGCYNQESALFDFNLENCTLNFKK